MNQKVRKKGPAPTLDQKVATSLHEPSSLPSWEVSRSTLPYLRNDPSNRLIKAVEILDVEILDHVIVTKHSFYSLDEHGHIEKLKWDTKYALSFTYQKKVAKKMEELKAEVEKEHKKRKLEGIKKGKEEEIEIGLTKGEKNKAKEIAKQMLAKGMDKKRISELTSLTHQWIGRIKNEIEDKK